jgi:predicted Zn-ribbon and HTH transcriptional regulator
MVELQDIFRVYGADFLKNHRLFPNQYKVMNDISNCRTSVLGGHTDTCDECGFTRISYNSCRNRHCPKCQTLTKERWIEARRYDLLNVGYFHIVFTLPEELNPIVYQNQETVYNILFKAVSETLMELAADKKYLGARIGITSILHTWGQNLHFHPHIHCVVPGGGLNECNQWVNSRKKFFIPVKVLSRKFRGKFLFFLKNAELAFYNSIADLAEPVSFERFLRSMYSKEWVVYCKPPFANSVKVIDYLGRYTHRVAISNNRILGMDNGTVTFKWRDYRDGNKKKVMSLSAEEFIRRFLMHVLPRGFVKIRHFGLLSSRTKALLLPLCKRLTNSSFLQKPTEKLLPLDLLLKLTGIDFSICPRCGLGHLSRAAPVSVTA